VMRGVISVVRILTTLLHDAWLTGFLQTKTRTVSVFLPMKTGFATPLKGVQTSKLSGLTVSAKAVRTKGFGDNSGLAPR
jgi:hypothetical protein